MVTVEDLRLDHVVSANDDIRLADRMEWLAGCGQDVLERLSSYEGGLQWSHSGRVALDEDGEVLCFWGADEAGAGSNVGMAWLVATNKAYRRARAIHRHLLVELCSLQSRFPVLECWADSRNVAHHEWLRWLGFEELEEKPYGLLGLPFKHFRRKV